MRDFKSFFLKSVPQKDRFLKGHKPTQEVFTKLFDSIGFIKEKSDKATTEDQGFVKLAGESNAKSFTVPDTDFSYAVQPNQMPETKEKNLDGAIGDMPLSTVEVVKDDTFNPNRTTFFLRLKQNFLQWLITRLLPPGGTAQQVLKKSSAAAYAATWEDADRIKVQSITADGIDYAYYKTPSSAGGSTYLISGQGILNLDIAFNSYILTGSPDPRPADFQAYGEYNIISMPGAKPGYRLKLRYTGDDKELAFFEFGVFSGNVDLGNFASIIGGRRGLIVNKNDTLTFVLDTNNKWVLWDYSSNVRTELNSGDTVRVDTNAISGYTVISGGANSISLRGASMHRISNMVHTVGKFAFNTTTTTGVLEISSFYTPISRSTEYIIGYGTIHTDPGPTGFIGEPVGGVEIWAKVGTDTMKLYYKSNITGSFLVIFNATFRA